MNPIDFCKNMNMFRIKAELSFTELSNELRKHNIDVSAPTLQRYESGKIKNVPYETIVALSEIFRIRPQELMGWENNHDIRDFNDILRALRNEIVHNGIKLDGHILTANQSAFLLKLLNEDLEILKFVISESDK